MKDIAYTEKNEYGYWVGCIEYANGVNARVTNAKHQKEIALEIAERMVANSEQQYAEKAEREKLARQNSYLYGHCMPGCATPNDKLSHG